MANSILPPSWEVPQMFRDRLGAKVGRQRAMFADGHLLLVLHAPPRIDDHQRVGRFFWRHPDGTWMSNELGTGINALTKHLAEFSDAVYRFDRMEEEADIADDYFRVLEGLAPLRRAARNMHRVLQEARKLVAGDRDIINARDQAYEIERTAELVYDGTKNGLDVAVARRAEEQARSSQRMAIAAHRLNLLAAFFFPIATLTAIFGVNLPTGLENVAPPFVFVSVIVIGLISGGLLTAFVTQSPDQRGRIQQRPESRAD